MSMDPGASERGGVNAERKFFVKRAFFKGFFPCILKDVNYVPGMRIYVVHMFGYEYI